MKDFQDKPEHIAGDQARRFLFEEADIRGEVVLLDTAFQDMLAIHQYAPGVSRLLGELLAAAVLLRSTLKFEGKLVSVSYTHLTLPTMRLRCRSRWSADH